ncbi:unnamed protein product [Eretmochelys imbricata]
MRAHPHPHRFCSLPHRIPPPGGEAANNALNLLNNKSGLFSSLSSHAAVPDNTAKQEYKHQACLRCKRGRECNGGCCLGNLFATLELCLLCLIRVLCFRGGEGRCLSPPQPHPV